MTEDPMTIGEIINQPHVTTRMADSLLFWERQWADSLLSWERQCDHQKQRLQTFHEDLDSMVVAIAAFDKLGGHYPHVFVNPRNRERLAPVFNEMVQAPVWSVEGLPLDKAVIIRTSPIDVDKTLAWEADRHEVVRATATADDNRPLKPL